MNSIKKLQGHLGVVLQICSLAGGLVILLMAVMVTADVVMRNVTGSPITGVFEISQVALLIATFLVLGYVQHYDRQLKADIFSSIAKGRKRAVLRLLDGILGFLFFSILLWTGAEEWIKALNGNFLKRGLIDIPTIIPLGVLVFGVLLVILALSLSIAWSFCNVLIGAPDEAPLEPLGGDAPLIGITPRVDLGKP